MRNKNPEDPKLEAILKVLAGDLLSEKGLASEENISKLLEHFNYLISLSLTSREFEIFALAKIEQMRKNDAKK